jgi:hypothetical protein
MVSYLLMVKIMGIFGKLIYLVKTVTEETMYRLNFIVIKTYIFNLLFKQK